MTRIHNHLRAARFDTYADLISHFPLRPLHDRHDYDNALEVAESLVGSDLNDDQADYLDVLTDIIQKYESMNYAITGKRDPIKMLKAMMDERGMNGSDLGRLLGNRQLGSLILTGRRELSKANVRILAEEFKVSASLLI